MLFIINFSNMISQIIIKMNQQKFNCDQFKININQNFQHHPQQNINNNNLIKFSAKKSHKRQVQGIEEWKILELNKTKTYTPSSIGTKQNFFKSSNEPKSSRIRVNKQDSAQAQTFTEIDWQNNEWQNNDGVDLAQLNQIEIKALALVKKQAQQRKRIKQLKQAYQQKIDELKKIQSNHLQQKIAAENQIIALKDQNKKLAEEKTKLEEAIKFLELDTQRTKGQIISIQKEKQTLLQKLTTKMIRQDQSINSGEKRKKMSVSSEIQAKYFCNNNLKSNGRNRRKVLQINAGMQLPFAQFAEQQRLILQKMNKQQLIQQLIKYRFKYYRFGVKADETQQYQSKKQQEQTMFESQICILNKRESICESIMYEASSQMEQIKQDTQLLIQTQNSFNKELLETQDGFFNCTFQKSKLLTDSCNPSKQQKLSATNFSTLGNLISKIIDKNTIKEHLQIYDMLKQFIFKLSLILQQKCTDQQQILGLVESSLSKMSNKFSQKAKQNINRIEKMLGYMKQSDKILEQKNLRPSLSYRKPYSLSNNYYQDQANKPI